MELVIAARLVRPFLRHGLYSSGPLALSDGFGFLIILPCLGLRGVGDGLSPPPPSSLAHKPLYYIALLG